MYPYASATFALVGAWSVGIATGVALADQEVGLIRDHPLFARRPSAGIVPPLAAAGLLSPFLLDSLTASQPPHWVLRALPTLLPFAVLAVPWSRAWLRRRPALQRRRLGLYAMAAGFAGLLLCTALALQSLGAGWPGVVPLAVVAGTAALLGSLTNSSLLAVTAGLPAEVPGGPSLGLAELAGAGLLCKALAGINTGLAWLGRQADWPATAFHLGLFWALGALLLPGGLLLARLLWRRLSDAALMPVALAAAVVGQFAALLLIFRYPGLVPLPPL